MARDGIAGDAPSKQRRAAPIADPSGLRRAQRAARRDLPSALRNAAELAVRDALLADPFMRRARRIGAYLALGGELDLGAYLDACLARGAEVYLPRLVRGGGRMRFARYDPELSLARNRFGIAEPARDAPTVAPRFLDAVLLPVVAYDAAGTRLGSGAGYYDRCFAFRTARQAWHAPLLVGVAFASQEVPALLRQPWDVPLDAVVTELGLRRFPTAPR
jgi:5-formyltetrahydrofolate cyclo-ligase